MSTAGMDYQQDSPAKLISPVQEQQSTIDTAEVQLSSQSTTQLRQRSIPTLEAADGSQKCYLLEIAAELRNSIYEYLLNTGDLRTCHPQILATCTRIRDEASGMLYANQPFTIRVRGKSVSLENVECGEVVLEDPVSDIKGLYWSACLNKVQHLRVLRVTPLQPIPENVTYCGRNVMHRVRIDEEDVGSFVSRLNVILYSLCTHLAKKNSITSVEIDVAAPTNAYCADSDKLEKVLYPLAMLKDLQKLDVFHHKPDVRIDNDQLLPHLKTNTPRPDLLKSLDSVIKDAEACADLLRILPQYQSFWARTMFERTLSLRRILQPEGRGFEVWMMTSEREKKLLNAEALLRQELSYVDTSRIGQQLCRKIEGFMEVLSGIAERQQKTRGPEEEDTMRSFAKLQFRGSGSTEAAAGEQARPQETMDMLRRWNDPASLRRSDVSEMDQQHDLQRVRHAELEKHANLPDKVRQWNDFAMGMERRCGSE